MTLARARRVAAVLSVIAVLTVGGGAAVGSASAATGSDPGPVLLSPASGTPRLPTTATMPNGDAEQIRELVPCGGMMYAVGTFDQVKWGSLPTFVRNGVFSFDASPPYTVSAFDPDVTTGTGNATVNTIAFNGSDCSHAYLGGQFTSVGGTAAKNIAEVDTTTGALVTGFRHSAGAAVQTIVGWNGHLLTGGYFTSINGSAADPYFTSLSPTTGANDGYLALAVSGSYTFVDQSGHSTVDNPTEVYNQQISPDGTRDLVEGDFTSMGGADRQQVAMLDLGATAAAVDSWYPPGFSGECSYNAPFYAQAGSWSPDGQTVYIASTGYRPSNAAGDNPNDPRAGYCDSAAAFSTSDAHLVWINYTGCDSLYATAADGSTAFFAGHERWSQNPNGCDAAGTNPVPIAAPGIEGLSPDTGLLTSNPTRSRGLGADDLVFTTAGLWVASDNSDGSDMCGGVHGLAGICLLPYQNPIATAPTVTGTPAVTHTVTCAEPRQPVVTGQTAVTTSYSWLLGGQPVATGSSYLIPGSAYGKSLACQASLQRGSGPASSAVSAGAAVAIGPALTATKAPALVRAPKVGHTDRVHRGTWSPRATSYTFQWYVAGTAVKGATAATFTVPARAAGKRLSCRVTAGATGYASGTRATASVVVPKPPKKKK